MEDNQNQQFLNLELQVREKQHQQNLSSNATSSVDTEDTSEMISYKPHALQALSLKVEDCLKKQRELNFLAREVSVVLKKLK